MISNRFGLFLLLRVALLAFTLFTFSVAVANSGYYGISVLSAIISLAVLFELYRYVNKTNAELTRLLESVRSGDFSQSFTSKNIGAGFEPLSNVMNDIMQGFKASRQQQEESLRHLKSLIEHIPVPLLSLSPNSQVHLHNNAARRLFGSVSVNKLDDLNIFGDSFRNSIENIEPGCRTLINYCYDDIERQLTVVATHVMIGNSSEKLLSLQDIQSELDDVQVQAWHDLVRVLTHEIMNSITPVASLAKTVSALVGDISVKINDNPNDPTLVEDIEDARIAMNTVSRRSDGLTNFVQNYRSLSHLPPPQKQRVELTKLFKNLEKLVAADWQEKGISLRVNLASQDPVLIADPDLLEQILINLLKNSEQALCASDKKIVDPNVSISVRINQRGRIVIDVADNGPGIPSNIIKKVFVPFFTTKQKGSGVGLALTRQIMVAHGGSITLNRTSVGGAKISLIF